LLQPAAAVAAALRAAGGALVGYPTSGYVGFQDVGFLRETRLLTPDLPNDLHAPGIAGKVPLSNRRAAAQPVYFGVLAPRATAVSLVGSFNGWLPDHLPLQPAHNGWWHGSVLLPPGRHAYRFWVTTPDAPAGDWLPDPEHQAREESGYTLPHSIVSI
jgi:hypothetical protein